jgi:hypothetical protein
VGWGGAWWGGRGMIFWLGWVDIVIEGLGLWRCYGRSFLNQRALRWLPIVDGMDARCSMRWMRGFGGRGRASGF